MPTTPLFPLPEGLEMTSISGTSEELLVSVTSHRASSSCPPQSVRRTAPRFHCNLLSPDQAIAHVSARHRICHVRQRRRTSE